MMPLKVSACFPPCLYKLLQQGLGTWSKILQSTALLLVLSLSFLVNESQAMQLMMEGIDPPHKIDLFRKLFLTSDFGLLDKRLHMVKRGFRAS